MQPSEVAFLVIVRSPVFGRFVLSQSPKFGRFVSDLAEIWICGLYVKSYLES